MGSCPMCAHLAGCQDLNNTANLIVNWPYILRVNDGTKLSGMNASRREKGSRRKRQTKVKDDIFHCTQKKNLHFEHSKKDDHYKDHYWVLHPKLIPKHHIGKKFLKV